MALGGCYTCLKYLMFVFNFIFWVSAALSGRALQRVIYMYHNLTKDL